MEGNERVLVVRLGAMGDLLHVLPAVESLGRRFPFASIDWIVKPQWIPLLEGNPHLRNVISYTRENVPAAMQLAQALRRERYSLAVDFQGLIQSALVARFSGAARVLGYDRRLCKEGLAARFYQQRIYSDATHIAERHLALAATLGAAPVAEPCWLPDGVPEGELPEGPFVLTSPFAGWVGKQWPMENYQQLAEILRRDNGLTLVVNVSPRDRAKLPDASGLRVHESGIPGLIHATRRAVAVVGVDSGPLHLAAALERPGVAIFGPTDPARNGPFGGRFRVLRHPSAATTYKRETALSESMKRVTVSEVREALQTVLE